MKLEQSAICKILNESRSEALRPVDEENLLADMNDKFYNFGVDHMFYTVLKKLYSLESIVKEVEV